MPYNDADLVERAQRGDREALTMIYDSYYPPIFRYIYYRLSDQDSAEDLASEVFVRMVARIEVYELCGHPILAWLYTIAHHLVADYYRKAADQNVLPLEESLIEGYSHQPAHLVERLQEQDCLAKAMAQLTEEQRQVVLLKFIEEYEVAEIASVLGKNERAVRSLQHRALATLNRAIEEEGCYES